MYIYVCTCIYCKCVWNELSSSRDTLAELRSDAACAAAKWRTRAFARAAAVFVEATNHWLDGEWQRLQAQGAQRKQTTQTQSGNESDNGGNKTSGPARGSLRREAGARQVHRGEREVLGAPAGRLGRCCRARRDDTRGGRG